MSITRPKSSHPLPKHAKKVFSGKMFDVYQWEQTLFTGEKSIFEKIKRPDTVSVIPITIDGKILLSEQEQPNMQPFVGMFGGRIDADEDPLSAAKRELLEESGYTAESYTLWFATQPIGKIEWAIYVFIGHGCKKVTEQHVDAGEKITVKAVTFEEFLSHAQQEAFRDTEITMKVLRALQNKTEMIAMKQLFFGEK